MRVPLLATDALRQWLSASAARPARKALLSPAEFQQRLRRAPCRSATTGAAAVGWGASSPSRLKTQAKSPVKPLTIETPAVAADPSVDENQSGILGKKPRTRAACWSRLKEKSREGNKVEAQAAVKELLYRYDERLSVQLYAALIAAETDPKFGSAVDVERLLEELEDAGIPRELEVYDAALKALAVHPDHVLRDMLLDEMKHTWLELNADHWHYVVASLVRERQLELALERLGDMRTAGVQPQLWLLHLLITACLSNTAFPEALSLLRYRGSFAEPIPSAIWQEALSKAAHNLCLPLVDYVWRRAVETNYLNPPSGTCTAVLDTASRRGNFRLAVDVLRVLRWRSSPLEVWHHEAVFEAFLTGGDLPGALRALGAMAKDGIEPTAAAVRPLVFHIRDDAARIEHVLAELAQLQTRRGNAASEQSAAWDPCLVLDVCIECYMSLGDLLGALKVFRSWQLYAPPTSRPSIETYNALLFNLFKVAGNDARRVAETLRSELIASGLAADTTTNNRLIFAYLAKETDDEGLNLALGVWKDMKDAGQDIFAFTAKQLVERVRAAHERNPGQMEAVLEEIMLEMEQH